VLLGVEIRRYEDVCILNLGRRVAMSLSYYGRLMAFRCYSLEASSVDLVEKCKDRKKVLDENCWF